MTEHTVGNPKSPSLDASIYKNYDFLNKNQFMLEHMIIDDPEEFRVTKKQKGRTSVVDNIENGVKKKLSSIQEKKREKSR